MKKLVTYIFVFSFFLQLIQLLKITVQNWINYQKNMQNV